MAEKKKTSSASKSSAKAKKQTAAAKNTAAANKKPKTLRREVCGLICLLMSVITLCLLFSNDGPANKWFISVFRSLVGIGFYALPFALFMDFVILVFHKGRPVRLRLIGTSGVVVCVGILGHLLGNTASISWGLPMIGELVRTGAAGTSGGLIAGFLGTVLKTVTGPIPVILTVVALALFLLNSFNMTVSSLIKAIQARPRVEKEPEREYEDTAEKIVNHIATKHIERVERRRASVAEFDLPVDDPPALEKPAAKSAKKKEQPQPEEAPHPEEVLEMPEWPELPEEEPVTPRSASTCTCSFCRKTRACSRQLTGWSW